DAPGAAAKASVEPGEPVADADHPQPAAQALSETRRVLIQVRMPPVGTPASSLSPAAAAPDQAPASKAAPAPEPVPAPQNP
ncbi:MAG: 2-oxoglutarate dehydrogenase, E2 component, dihydrolipoamide succinyltransferase, partial [Planctomycetaceae bacterium]